MFTRSGISPNPHIAGEPVSMSLPLVEETDSVTANNIHALHQFAQKPHVGEEHLEIMINSYPKNEWDDLLAELDTTTDTAPYKPLLQTVDPAWLVNSSKLGLSPGSETPPLDEHIFSEIPSRDDSTNSVTPDVAENTAIVNSLPGPLEVAESQVVMFNVPPPPFVDLKTALLPQKVQESQQTFPPYGPDPNAQSTMATTPVYPISFNYTMPPYGYVSPQYQHPYQMMPSMGAPINRQQSFAASASVTPSPPPKPSPELVSNKRTYSFISEMVPKNFVANPNNHGRWRFDRQGNREYLNGPAAKRSRTSKL
ncbi:hypothetical protein N7507_005978 [Penicillium longicatenatum]|nr:hypothetical protein N7507_005978 [Penicillium longicatenatum]